MLLAPSLPSVCAVGRGLGCLTEAVLVPSCPTPSESPWHYAALLPCPAAQPPAAGGRQLGTPFTGRFADCSCPRRQVLAPLQPEVCTAASPFSLEEDVVLFAKLTCNHSYLFH